MSAAEFRDHMDVEVEETPTTEPLGLAPDAVEVRRNAGLAAFVGALASGVAIAYLARAANTGAPLDWGLAANPEFAPYSLLVGAYRSAIPVTVHVAVGTDTPHTHPKADAAAIGETTHRDFRLLCSLVRGLDQGGVYLNLGSAVLLPEVFLKAVSTVRNLGNPLAGFTTVNLDFIQHYRPKVNVVERPHTRSGGHGYAITGHHELMIPLLAAALVDLA